MKVADLFINGKKMTVKNKSKAQLEHMLQLSLDDIRRYKVSIQNYPPDRMERNGKPFLAKLQSYVDLIQQALKAYE